MGAHLEVQHAGFAPSQLRKARQCIISSCMNELVPPMPRCVLVHVCLTPAQVNLKLDRLLADQATLRQDVRTTAPGQSRGSGRHPTLSIIRPHTSGRCSLCCFCLMPV